MIVKSPPIKNLANLKKRVARKIKMERGIRAPSEILIAGAARTQAMMAIQRTVTEEI